MTGPEELLTEAEEPLTSFLRMLGDTELADAELDQRTNRFQDALRQLHDDPAEDVPLGPQVKARGTDRLLREGRRGTAERATTTHSRRRSQAQMRRRLVKVLRRRRISRAAALDILVAEDLLIGAGRDPAMATHGETLIRAVGEADADRRMARAQRDRAGRRIDQLQARQAKLRIRAEQGYNELARHPDGGHRAVAELQEPEEGLRDQIDSEIAEGSRKHHRLPRWIRQLPKLVLAADFCLLLYFFSGITNVNWATPFSAALTFAVLLATVVTTLSYRFLGFTGYRLRIHKNHSGTIHREDLDGPTRTAGAAAVVGSASIAALMFIRMRTEVLSALGPQGWVTALVIALVLAAVSLLANFLVVGIRALDGSDETARLEALSAATSGLMSRARRRNEEDARLKHRIEVLQRRANRTQARAVTEAEYHLGWAERVIMAARAVHQGAGPYSCPASDPSGHEHVAGYRDHDSALEPDLRPGRTTQEHIDIEEQPGRARASADAEEIGYRGPTACVASGVTYRQLDYWARAGLVEPSMRAAHGSGSQRLYSFRDILVLKVVKQLLDTGISLQQIRTAVQHLRDRGTTDLTQVTLMSDGNSVYECTSADQVIHLLQGGQGVFGIALGRLWREVEGDLAVLPAVPAENDLAMLPAGRDERLVGGA